MNHIKQPTRRNWRSGNVCFSPLDFTDLRVGDTITIMKQYTDEVLVVVEVVQWMLDKADNRGDFVLVPTR